MFLVRFLISPYMRILYFIVFFNIKAVSEECDHHFGRLKCIPSWLGTSSLPQSSEYDKPALKINLSLPPQFPKDDKPELKIDLSLPPQSPKDDEPELKIGSSKLPQSSSDKTPKLKLRSSKLPQSPNDKKPKLKLRSSKLPQSPNDKTPKLKLRSSKLPQSPNDKTPKLKLRSSKLPQSPNDKTPKLKLRSSKLPQSPNDKTPKLKLRSSKQPQSPNDDKPELNIDLSNLPECPDHDDSDYSNITRRLPRSANNRNHELSIGFMFKQFSNETQKIIQKFIEHKSGTLQMLGFKLNILVNVMNTADIFKISRTVCHQLSRGVILIFGVISPESYAAYYPYTNHFKIPFLTPLNPVVRQPTYNDGLTIFTKPEYTDAVIDILNHYNWGPIIYIFTSGDGVLQLQAIFQKRIPKREKFTIDYTYQASNASDAIEFLIKIEEQNPYSKKFIVLDSSAEFATEVLKKHVKELRLGRRNFHYLLIGFAMDNIDEANIKNFGAINITGFALLDKSVEDVRDALKLANRDSISAELALLYDAIEIVVEAILNEAYSIPGFLDASKLRNLTSKDWIKDCNSVSPFELGRKFLNNIKKTAIYGITGFVGFNDKGERRNYTLQVMRINYNSKKLEKIGTWQEGKGLLTINGRVIKPESYGKLDRTKTYIISTIVEYPYLFSKAINDDPQKLITTGFCDDLAELLMYKLELNYKMIIVKDGRYGNRNEKSISGWDGLIGEILRREADMVVAPLTVRSDRQEVVHFSQPFLSFLKANIENPNLGYYDKMFFFFKPFSSSVWALFLLSIVACILCLQFIQYIRRPIKKRRASTRARGRAALNAVSEVDTTETEQKNTLLNNTWFVITALFQQGKEPLPTSFAEGTTVTVWWFFILAMTAMYTASLSSYFSVLYMNQQDYNHIMTTECTKDNYRTPIESGEDTDAHLKFIPGIIEEDEICHLILSSIKPGIKEFGIVLDKGSQLRRPVDLALQALKREGEIERLIRKWFVSSKLSPPIGSIIVPLSIEYVSGLFIILAFGLLLSMSIQLFLYFWNKRKDSNIETAFEPTEEVENQVAEDFEGPPSLHDTVDDMDSIVTLELEPVEQYGVPLNRNKRLYSASYQKKASSTKRKEVARSLNQVTSGAYDGPSVTRTRRKKPKLHDLSDT